jgi:transposase
VCQCDYDGDDTRRCYPSSLTDGIWAIIKPLVPVRALRNGGRPRTYDDRLVLDALFYVLHSGCRWRMLPHDLVPFDAAHRWPTWRTTGTWDKVHDELRRQGRSRAGRNSEPASVDAQSIKSSEGGQAVGFAAGQKTTGRKRHLITDTLGLLLVVRVPAASVQDRPGGRAILARLAAAFRTVAVVWADGGSANSIDEGLLSGAKAKLGLVVEIVERADGATGFTVLPRRWVAERTFAWLVRNRRLARDYERLTANSETMIKAAMIRLMAARLAGETACWSNALERQAARRLTVEGILAA